MKDANFTGIASTLGYRAEHVRKCREKFLAAKAELETAVRQLEVVKLQMQDMLNSLGIDEEIVKEECEDGSE